jgi:hypothetical protein
LGTSSRRVLSAGGDVVEAVVDTVTEIAETVVDAAEDVVTNVGFGLAGLDQHRH